ncbi:MAG: ankyrin repeat domain-containing protein [Pseudomonadota bacterium]
MAPLPENPDINQLKRQAKELLAAARAAEPEALSRFAAALPALKGQIPDARAVAALRLHDAQSCIAREYGFASWAALRSHVEVVRLRASDPAAQRRAFALRAYPGDIIGDMNKARPADAARIHNALPGLIDDEPALAPAIGATEEVRRQIARDAGWVHLPGGPLHLPPLVAATHSSLVTLPEYRAAIHETVDLLLAAGADPNQSVGSRWPPASVAAPSEEHRISALYGAAGQHHDAELTAKLLAAGADPDDGESLYHSLEGPDPACTRLLLEAGATVAGTNAIYHALDYDDLDRVKLLLAYAGDVSGEGKLLHWAIRRRRSAAHIAALLDVGVDPRATADDGTSAYVSALRYGLPEIADLLQRAGAQIDLSPEDAFVAACARGDTDTGRRLLQETPDLIDRLNEKQLRMLPELAAAGCTEAVRAMVELGWPISVRGGDWKAGALNHSVFQGNAALTAFLLAHGAVWTEEHAFNDNASGTLSWASINTPVPEGDWLACAEVLVAHGMPGAVPNPSDPETVLVDGVTRVYSDEVTAYLLSVGEPAPAA